MRCWPRKAKREREAAARRQRENNDDGCFGTSMAMGVATDIDRMKGQLHFLVRAIRAIRLNGSSTKIPDDEASRSARLKRASSTIYRYMRALRRLKEILVPNSEGV
jgi:hypothetical protein